MGFFKKTVILNISMLPEEYKTNTSTLKENIEKYERDFNVKIIPVESKENYPIIVI